MARELITDWTGYAAALDRLLAIASEQIDIYDEDLSHLGLIAPARLEALQRVLHRGRNGNAPCLRIAVRDATRLRREHPGLFGLLQTYGHVASVTETPEQLAHLRDNMVLIDQRHALIRFDRDQPRSKLLIDESDEILPYLYRFSEIIAEGGSPIGSSTLGL